MIRMKMKQVTRVIMNKFPNATIHESYTHNTIIINNCKVVLNKIDGNINVQETSICGTGIFKTVLDLIKGVSN